jgi:hypothetical protein
MSDRDEVALLSKAQVLARLVEADARNVAYVRASHPGPDFRSRVIACCALRFMQARDCAKDDESLRDLALDAEENLRAALEGWR